MRRTPSTDPQDMLNMGGLRTKMPATFWTFLIGGLALAGFPLITAGFWSKDEIFADAFANGRLLVFGTLALAALLTAFYTMRQITLTFLGQPRTEAAGHAHESKWTMTLPLIVLAVFAVGAGWVGIPEDFPLIGGLLPNWMHDFVGGTLLEHPPGARVQLDPAADVDRGVAARPAGRLAGLPQRQGRRARSAGAGAGPGPHAAQEQVLLRRALRSLRRRPGLLAGGDVHLRCSSTAR